MENKMNDLILTDHQIEAFGMFLDEVDTWLLEIPDCEQAFIRDRLSSSFIKYVLGAVDLVYDDVVFSRIYEAIRGVIVWRKAQIDTIAHNEQYVADYKIADPGSYMDRRRFAIAYCGALDEIKNKSDSMIISVMEYYLPMFSVADDSKNSHAALVPFGK